MTKKKQFIEAIERLKDFKKEKEKLQKVIDVISPSSTGVVEFGSKFEEDYIRLMEITFNDNNDKWIEWFVFENDFGKKKHNVIINGVETTITNSSIFYDTILKEHETK